MFKKTFDGTRLKTNLRLAVNRLKLLEKKKTEMGMKARKEIAEYLQNMKYDRARVRVEGVIRDDYLVEALEMTEMCCELLVGRIGILETTSNDVAPLDLEECICSILFAARRIYQDVPEMVEITRQLQKKFKKEAFAQLQQSESRKANQKLVSRLDIRPPPKALVEQYLVEIAKSHNVDFNPDPLALDGSVDALSSSDFGAVDGDSNNKGGGGGGGGGMPGGAATADTEYIDLINFDPNGAPSGTHQPPPNAAAHGIGPGYPMQQQQPQMFPQAPPLNPNYNPNMIGPHTPHHIPPPGAHNPMGPSNAPNGAPSNGVPRPPPSYEESGGESGGEKERMGGDEFPNANNGDASTGQDNLQQWSDLQFNLPPVPDYLNGGGGGGLSDSTADSATVPPPTGPPGGNQQQGPPDENGAGGGGASLDMDDLEARLRRLKGL